MKKKSTIKVAFHKDTVTGTKKKECNTVLREQHSEIAEELESEVYSNSVPEFLTAKKPCNLISKFRAGLRGLSIFDLKKQRRIRPKIQMH